MKNEYFNGDINGNPLRITNAYVSYMDSIIPVNSISCIAKKSHKYSYWRSVVLLIITIACFVTASQFDIEELVIVGQVFGGLTLFAFVLATILNCRVYLQIFSHSKESIEIPLWWLRKRKVLDPVYNALIQAIEDNHSIQNNTIKDI